MAITGQSILVSPGIGYSPKEHDGHDAWGLWEKNIFVGMMGFSVLLNQCFFGEKNADLKNIRNFDLKEAQAAAAPDATNP